MAEPSYEHLDSLRERFDGKWDLFVGIGGGSTLDVAKAMSVLVTNPGPAISYRGFDLVSNPGPPLIAIPTTAGSGSEVTPNAVFTDLKENRKFGINSRYYVPRLALLDPLLTLSCPRDVTVSSGMDALVHAVESYVALSATPMSRMFSREAFRLLMVNLPRIIGEPDNLTLRGNLQLAALLAATGLMHSGGGVAGALSYPLGVRFNVPHGLAGGIFLGPVAAWNAERGSRRYGELADQLPEVRASSSSVRAHTVASALKRIASQLGVPTCLSEVGVELGDIPMMVEQTFLLHGALEQNPTPVSRSDLEALLSQLV
ncbi:MAG: iron-containing alcohol dehydrogenase [Gemmatimonadetes bacterium]|nr:iron-containing alcohol dehydrogenase [Gemmatimonadota bacterium]